jgi:hypothetical protein
MPGSGRPDTPLITNYEISLSNYQHLYTSAFFSITNPKTTNLVQFNEDTLLDPFINLVNFQQNQPHLPANKPTTLITNNLQHEIIAQSTHNSLTVNVVKVSTLFMAKTSYLRKYHALQVEKIKLQ